MEGPLEFMFVNLVKLVMRIIQLYLAAQEQSPWR